MSKLPARKMVRSRDSQTKEFHRAGSEFGSTVFENNKRNSIQTVSFPRIKAREGMKIVIMKNFYFRNEVVREWMSRRNMPNIIQSRVGSKGLSKQFNFRERRDSCGAI